MSEEEKTKTSIKINPELWKAVKIEAAKRNLQISVLLEKAIATEIGFATGNSRNYAIDEYEMNVRKILDEKFKFFIDSSNNLYTQIIGLRKVAKSMEKHFDSRLPTPLTPNEIHPIASLLELVTQHLVHSTAIQNKILLELKSAEFGMAILPMRLGEGTVDVLNKQLNLLKARLEQLELSTTEMETLSSGKYKKILDEISKRIESSEKPKDHYS